MSGRFVAIALPLFVAACAQTPKPLACNLPLAPLESELPALARAASPRPAATAPPPATYEDYLRRLHAPPVSQVPGTSAALAAVPRHLLLSGGGQHGAFGAGVLAGLAARPAGLPRYELVTGISTGALLGGFALTGATDNAVVAYTLAAESDVLDVKARGLVGQVRAGAVGDLKPLRRRLDDMLDRPIRSGNDAILTELAEEGGAGRFFLAGVVEARSGRAAVVDMTALARRWAAMPAGSARDSVKACYIEALIASSSEPLAAPPVFIDRAMFIDGGARFGVFQAADAAVRAEMAGAGAPPVNHVLINGDLTLGVQCPDDQKDPTQCDASAPLRDWNLLELGLRSVRILQDQVQRFSVAAALAPGDPPIVRVNPDMPAFQARIDDLPGEPAATKTCAAWRAIDRAETPPPAQFEKRYMRCLIAYGRERATALPW